MALDQSSLLTLLDASGPSEDGDLVRQLSERMLQELIEAEATAHIGAGPGECSETRTNQRNGHRPKTLTTAAGDLELRIMEAGWHPLRSLYLEQSTGMILARLAGIAEC